MAGRIPQSFINDLLARADIVDLIDSRVTLKKAGRNYQARCPFHDEKTPSFSVSPDKQFYYCFGCGASGTALTFLMEFDRLQFVEAVETLARHVGVEVPRESGGRPTEDHAAVYAALGAAEGFFRAALRAAPVAVEYLKGRGLTGTVARDFGIGYAPDEWQALGDALGKHHSREDLLQAGLLTRNDNGRVYDRFRGRVMFPIRDTRGRVIGFGGRVLGGSQGGRTQGDGDGPKYLNSPETPVFHKGRELYGLYEARRALRRIDTLLVVEGYMDVVALAQAGIANCVATLGTAATSEHFQKLFRYASEVICCFDGDSAGRQAAWRALESALGTLTDGRQLKFMFLPDGEDPDSLVRKEGRAAFLTRAAGASAAIEYLFARLGESVDTSELDGQARLASLAMPYIERVPTGILRQLMQRRLESLTGFSASPRELSPSRSSVPPQSRVPPQALESGGRDAPRRGAASAAGLSALERRLLGYLLRAPELATRLADEARAALDNLGESSVFAEIVAYVARHPETDSSDLLGRWSGHAVHPELLALLERPPRLDVDAMEPEFRDGVDRFVELARRAERRALLARLRAEPSAEALRELWQRARDDVDSGESQTDVRAGNSAPSEASN